MTRENGVLDLFDQALPWRRPFEFEIEFDNAKPHIGKSNIEAIREAAKNYGFSISLQTGQSPDQNPLDLALNYAFMTRSHNFNTVSHNFDDLLLNVYEAYTNYPTYNIRRAYSLLYEVYKEILKKCGAINYKMPHTHISLRQRIGEEEIDELVEVEVVQNAAQFIIDH